MTDLGFDFRNGMSGVPDGVPDGIPDGGVRPTEG